MTDDHDTSLAHALARVLRGEAAALEANRTQLHANRTQDDEALVDAIEAEGVLPLVAAGLAHVDASPTLRASLTERAQRVAVVDVVREQELRQLVAALAKAGVAHALMKGAHLAYWLYPRPDLRPRLDSDILVSSLDQARAEGVLHDGGYARVAAQQEGDLLMYQRAFHKVANGVTHTVDLHWRALNPQVFSAIFDTSEQLSRAVPLPRLSADARGLASVDAMVLALVHRIAHHRGHRPLIWTYDVHLLSTVLGSDDWQAVTDTASRAGVAAICLDGLQEARAMFGARVADGVLNALRVAAQVPSPTAGYLGTQRHADMVLADIKALRGWSARWRLVRQYAFPSRRYMRDVYARGSTAPLVWLYAQRIGRGGLRWMRRRPQ